MLLQEYNEKLSHEKELRRTLQNKINKHQDLIQNDQQTINQKYEEIISNINEANLSLESAQLLKVMNKKESLLSKLTQENEQMSQQLAERIKEDEYKISYMRGKAEYAELKAENDRKRAKTLKSVNDLQQELEKLSAENNDIKNSIEQLQNDIQAESENVLAAEEKLKKHQRSKARAQKKILEAKDTIQALLIAQEESKKIALEKQKGIQQEASQQQEKLQKMRNNKNKLLEDVQKYEEKKSDLEEELKVLSAELTRAMSTAAHYMHNV